MAITVDFSGSAIGVSFTAGSATVAQLLNANPTLPISLPATGLTADNLTFIGVFAPAQGSSTVWRITNFGPAVSSATLSQVGGVYSTTLSLPANSFTFVSAGTTDTYQLTIDGATITKAAGTTTISLGNPPAPAGQTTVSRINSNVPHNIIGSNFNDTLTGGGNTDTIDGGAGDDNIVGLQGGDSILGGTGNDAIQGNSGGDTINGGAGADTIFGGTIGDTITGGTGIDRFAYAASNEGADTITDFSTGVDTDSIQISASGGGFVNGGLTLGLLTGTQFLRGAGVVAATDNLQRFLYNTTDGALRFDADGIGGAFAPVQLATLTGAPAAFDHGYIVIVA